MFTITELLDMRGFKGDPTNTKLVRHQHPPWDLSELLRRGQFDIYQWLQSKPIFHKCKYVISLLGTEHSKARLVGIYRLTGHEGLDKHVWPEDFIFPDIPTRAQYLYHVEKLSDFDDFVDRLVIDWGLSPRAWHQWLKPREILEILPQGFIGAFPGYMDFVLSFSQLREMITHKNANILWFHRLSLVGGIYLILDTETGMQYVGSASGVEGIWGRWSNYVKNGHGGNIQLKELLENNPKYAHNFKFSLLQVLPRNMLKKEVIRYESMYKEKLGTRAFGLTGN